MGLSGRGPNKRRQMDEITDGISKQLQGITGARKRSRSPRTPTRDNGRRFRAGIESGARWRRFPVFPGK